MIHPLTYASTYLLVLPAFALQRKKFSMPKIALIGAGSIVFTRNLCSDILLAPALQESTICLMDIDPARWCWRVRWCRP